MKGLTRSLDRSNSLQNTAHSYHRSQETLPKISLMAGVFILLLWKLAHCGSSLFKATIICGDLEQHFFFHIELNRRLIVRQGRVFQTHQDPGTSEKLRFQTPISFRPQNQLRLITGGSFPARLGCGFFVLQHWQLTIPSHVGTAWGHPICIPNVKPGYSCLNKNFCFIYWEQRQQMTQSLKKKKKNN